MPGISGLPFCTMRCSLLKCNIANPLLAKKKENPSWELSLKSGLLEEGPPLCGYRKGPAAEGESPPVRRDPEGLSRHT